MPHIAIISSSVRMGRKSHYVALYFKKFIEENNFATADLVDLMEYQFPLFNERLKYHLNITPQMQEFVERTRAAQGILIVTPEYNGGYPASLKNVVDFLDEEWVKKPVAISTVSAGKFGGSQVITSLQFSLWKLKALTVPAVFPIAKVEEAFDADGNPKDKLTTDKHATIFVKELLWMIKAKENAK